MPRAGQKTIPLADWARFLKVADWWDRTHGFKEGSLPGPRTLDPAFVTIKNSSGADRAQHDCLKLGTHQITDPDQFSRMIDGVAVASPADAVAILQAPVADGEWSGDRMAQVSGCCWAYVDIDATSGLDHNRAIPKAADYQLQSAFAGPHRILWQPGSTGKQLCLVQLWAPCQPLYALTGAGGIGAATIAGSGTTTTITPASATCSLFYWDEPNNQWAILKRSGSAVTATIYNNWDEPIGSDAIIKVSSADDGKLTVDSELCGEA